MFRDTRKQKLRNRVIYAALGVAVLTFGIWLNYQDASEEEASKAAAQKTAVEEAAEAGEEKTETAEEEALDISEKTPEEETGEPLQEEASGTDTESIPETYLIKEVEGVVKVFICDGEGNKELYLITSIPFDLLSESDQQLFIDGVELETEEDLGKFLENFDS